MSRESRLRRVRERREAAAHRYKPDQVRLLLVAEAPPADDHRYFYFEDVTSHDFLFLGVTEAYLHKKLDSSEKAKGLAELRDSGVFLVDLMLDPVDGSKLESHVPDLIQRCRKLEPERIILIKATVFDAAYHALRTAGLPVVNKRVYFPSHGWQHQFQEQFREALMMEVQSGQPHQESLVR